VSKIFREWSSVQTIVEEQRKEREAQAGSKVTRVADRHPLNPTQKPFHVNGTRERGKVKGCHRGIELLREIEEKNLDRGSLI